MPEQHSNDENEVTSEVLAERFRSQASERGIELHSGEVYGANLKDLMRPGEVLQSNRGRIMKGHCAECDDQSEEQTVKACEFCQVLLCSKHWPDHSCAGKDAVDFIMRKEHEAEEQLIAAAEQKHRAFRAEMERFRPKDEIQAAEWDSAWNAHWREWKAWLEIEWAGVRLGHWGDKSVVEVLHQEEQARNWNATQRMKEGWEQGQEALEQERAKRADVEQENARYKEGDKPWMEKARERQRRNSKGQTDE